MIRAVFQARRREETGDPEEERKDEKKSCKPVEV